jgi:hypothetical protein
MADMGFWKDQGGFDAWDAHAENGYRDAISRDDIPLDEKGKPVSRPRNMWSEAYCYGFWLGSVAKLQG